MLITRKNKSGNARDFKYGNVIARSGANCILYNIPFFEILLIHNDKQVRHANKAMFPATLVNNRWISIPDLFLHKLRAEEYVLKKDSNGNYIVNRSRQIPAQGTDRDQYPAEVIGADSPRDRGIPVARTGTVKHDYTNNYYPWGNYPLSNSKFYIEEALPNVTYIPNCDWPFMDAKRTQFEDNPLTNFFDSDAYDVPKLTNTKSIKLQYKKYNTTQWNTLEIEFDYDEYVQNYSIGDTGIASNLGYEVQTGENSKVIYASSKYEIGIASDKNIVKQQFFDPNDLSKKHTVIVSRYFIEDERIYRDYFVGYWKSVIDGLDPDTEYEVQVVHVANDGNNTETIYNHIKIRTLQTPEVDKTITINKDITTYESNPVDKVRNQISNSIDNINDIFKNFKFRLDEGGGYNVPNKFRVHVQYGTITEGSLTRDGEYGVVELGIFILPAPREMDIYNYNQAYLTNEIFDSIAYRIYRYNHMAGYETPYSRKDIEYKNPKYYDNQTQQSKAIRINSALMQCGEFITGFPKTIPTYLGSNVFPIVTRNNFNIVELYYVAYGLCMSRSLDVNNLSALDEFESEFGPNNYQELTNDSTIITNYTYPDIPVDNP